MERLIPVLDKVGVAALFVFVAFSISITQIAGGVWAGLRGWGVCI